MAYVRMTRQCPGIGGAGKYYVPLDRLPGQAETRILHGDHAGSSLHGDVANRLGQYEDLGYSPKELEEIIARLKRLGMFANPAMRFKEKNEG